MISTEFKQNVETGDLVTVRSALVDYLIIDRTFEKFDEALAYARTKLDIIQPYDKVPFDTEEKWSNKYLNQQKVALMVNFSEERIHHIMKVIQNVLPANSIRQTEMPSSQSTREVRTGRNVLSEKAVQTKNTCLDKSKSLQQKRRTSRESTSGSRSNGCSTASRTGTRIISETRIENQPSEEKSKSEDGIGTVMIVGGVTLASLGLAMVEPIVVGAGVVIAGAGVGVKVKSRR